MYLDQGRYTWRHNGCKTYLEQGRYTWRHNSILNCLATSLKAVNESTIYADIPGYLSPSIINLRPDLLLKTNNKYLYILEFTVGFESNLHTNETREHSKYASLLSDLQRKFKCVSFVNLSMSSLGIFGNSCNSFFKMCDSLSPLTNNKNGISFLNFPTLPPVLRTTYFVAKINHGQIQNYILFNFGCFIFLSFPFYLTIVIVSSCKARLANCKLPCNSEI